jgi:ABC-type branched-subunit amino acid transport system ATPase component
VAEPLLRVEGVSKHFGGLAAVDRASFAAAAGRITALIGPNGAGKTTLFAIIAGFLKASEGSVHYDGADVTGLPPHRLARRGIARTFQIAQPFAGLTVAENIAVGAHLHHAARADALAAAGRVAEAVGLARDLDKPALALTVAGRKRLELARALATQPRLLLLDEVLAGLNPSEVRDMLPVVREIAARGVTIVMIEHVMQAVMSLAEHVCVLAEGRIIAQGTPAAIAADRGVVEAYLGHGAASSGQGANAPSPRVRGEGRGEGAPPRVAASDPLLAVEYLVAGYGATEILRGVDLTVAPHEIVAVLGANGAGKSTLNRVLSGVLRASRGRIRFAGAPIERARPAAIVRDGLIHVPEGRRIFPNLTVRENIDLGAFRRARARRAQNRERVFSVFPRLAERQAQRAGTLSGGEQQMLAIGRGLMAEPRLLILDEPSLGLSPRLVEELFALIRRINAEGVALLLVEQNVVASLDVAQRAYILDNGRFVLEGDAATLRDDPALKRAYLGM